MENNIFSEKSPDFITERSDSVVSIRLTGNFFNDITDLTKREKIFACLERINKADEIKAVVIDSSHESCNSEDYKKFFLKERTKEVSFAFHRLCNVVNQFILNIMGLDKIVIHACCGKKISFFLSLTLACDYGIVAEDTVFYNSYLDMGMLPKGGLPFLLQRFVGPRKTYEILLLSRKITAQQALSYGIVEQVVPADALEESALAAALRFGQINTQSLTGIKRLVTYSTMGCFEKYLEFENQEIKKVFNPLKHST